jgi:endonuclease YncB( thermonuclease family)
MKYFPFLIVAISILCTCGISTSDLKPGDSISGKVISIIDGDTYDIILKGNRTIRIRMEGIDAPEKGMPFYKVSKKFLSDLCYNKNVSIYITGEDDYNRFLARTYLNKSTELGQEMIKAGFAWHFKKYSSDTILSRLEIEARNQKRGLWIDERPMAPWTNRSLHWQGISTKDSFNIKQND